MNIRMILAAVVGSAALCSIPETFGDQICVVNSAGNTIGKYTTSGAIVNPMLISGLSSPQGVAVAGGHLFVVNSGKTLSVNTTLAPGW